LSSLGSTSASIKRKQPSMEVPTAAAFIGAGTQPAAADRPLLDDDSPTPIPMGGAAGPVGISSTTKKAKTLSNSTQQAAPMAIRGSDHNAMMSYIEREWAVAAARNGGENVFQAYMDGIELGQLSSNQQQQQQQQQQSPLEQLQQPQQQEQLLPMPLLQPTASKHASLPSNAPLQQLEKQQQEVYQEDEEEEDVEEEPKQLTTSQRNKLVAKDLIEMIQWVELDDDVDEIYDSCPEVAEKINQFLQLDGVNKKIFLEYAMDQKDGYVPLKAFLDGTNQSQCRNKIYGKAFFFFEKLRLLEGHGKSEERLRNEALFPDGFSTSEPDAQFGSHDLLQESDEDSETDLKCDENFA